MTRQPHLHLQLPLRLPLRLQLCSHGDAEPRRLATAHGVSERRLVGLGDIEGRRPETDDSLRSARQMQQKTGQPDFIVGLPCTASMYVASASRRAQRMSSTAARYSSDTVVRSCCSAPVDSTHIIEYRAARGRLPRTSVRQQRDARPFQRRSHLAQSVPDARLDGAQRNAELISRTCVRDALQEHKLDRIALHERQYPERTPKDQAELP